jgi:hypothetical protein
MSSFKAKVYELCGEVVSEFPGWSFASGVFKNKTLKHTNLAIGPGFSFRDGNTSLQPALVIEHKKSMAMFKKLIGYDQPTSIVPFQNVAQLLQHTPQELRLGGWILEDKNLQMTVAPPSETARHRMIDLAEARSVLRAVIMDGIALIGTLYDLSSEDNLLRSLPPKYNTRASTIPYDEFERNKGVMMCIVRALAGDFDFAESYRSDSYQTVFPKRIKEIDNVIAALPELKRLYGETHKPGHDG